MPTTRPPNTSGPPAGERVFQMNDLASLADVHGRRDERDEADGPHDGAGVEHRGALAVRALALGVEEVARARDDAAEDRLDLHGARAVHHLDLGADAGAAAAVAATARRRREAATGGGRRVLRSRGGRRERRRGRRGEAAGAAQAHARLLRAGRRGHGGRRHLRLGCVEERDLDAAVAEHDLVARLEARLADALAVHQRAARRAQVDDVDLVRPGDLDHRVHARHGLVIDPEVRGGELPHLDDVLGEDLFANERVPLVDLELDGDLHVGHGVVSCGAGSGSRRKT
jgi:hypothetical protein